MAVPHALNAAALFEYGTARNDNLACERKQLNQLDIEARTTQIQMVVARTSPRRLCLIRSGVSLPVVCRLEYPPELPPRRRPMVHLVRGSRATWRHRPSSTTESRQQVLVSHVGRPPIEPSPCLLRGRLVRWHRRRADLDHVPEGAEPAVPQYRLSSVGLAKVARTPPRITSPLRRPSEPKPRSLDSSRPTRIHRRRKGRATLQKRMRRLLR